MVMGIKALDGSVVGPTHLRAGGHENEPAASRHLCSAVSIPTTGKCGAGRKNGREILPHVAW
jgi:hypothetical protein